MQNKKKVWKSTHQWPLIPNKFWLDFPAYKMVVTIRTPLTIRRLLSHTTTLKCSLRLWLKFFILFLSPTPHPKFGSGDTGTESYLLLGRHSHWQNVGQSWVGMI